MTWPLSAAATALLASLQTPLLTVLRHRGELTVEAVAGTQEATAAAATDLRRAGTRQGRR